MAKCTSSIKMEVQRANLNQNKNSQHSICDLNHTDMLFTKAGYPHFFSFQAEFAGKF